MLQTSSAALHAGYRILPGSHPIEFEPALDGACCETCHTHLNEIVRHLPSSKLRLASRAAPVSLSAAVLGLYGFLAIVVAGLFYWGWEQKDFVLPDLQTALTLLAAVLWGAFAYLSLMKAMRTGSVSVVTPFRYSRLLFGIGLGVIFFDETIDMPMAIGCTIVVASGLFILIRGSRKAA